MGTYRFKWPHTAESVKVSGNWDNWEQQIPLDKKDWVHEKVLYIPEMNEEIMYKFIVNGQWRIDPSHATMRDHDNNENNILDHDDLHPLSEHQANQANILSVGPGATTTALAGAQPIEDKTASLPGAFPQTPGEGPGVSTLQDRVVGVNPIPATSGIGNPVHLQPGEPVPDPSTITGNTVQSTVTTDKESYERGAGGAAYAPPGKGDDSAAQFGRPAAGGPTTADLAGQQPIEPRGTPQVISKSGEGEDEGVSGKVAAGVAAATVATAGAAVAANEIIKDKTGTDPAGALPAPTHDALHEKAQESNIPEQAGVAAPGDTAPDVPDEVTESQKEAKQSPEASANPEAVKEKSETEKELLSKVPESEAQGEPAPTASAAAATTVPAATTSETGAPQLGDPTGGGLAPINMDDKAPLSTASATAANTSYHGETKPAVTTGIASSSTPQTSIPTPQKRQSFVDRLKSSDKKETTTGAAATSSASTPADKKEKKPSLIRRIINKLKS